MFSIILNQINHLKIKNIDRYIGKYIENDLVFGVKIPGHLGTSISENE